MALNKIIIENFRAFQGQHTFDLRQLNLFTGANNSGKSTLIKAISLFSKGLAKGDFPLIDLFETSSGSFQDLLNRDTDSKSFKIGFFIELGEKKVPLKVLYEFVDGGGTNKSENSAVFNKLEIRNQNEEVLLFIQNAETFNDDDSVNYRDEGYPINSPIAYDNPALAFLAFNVAKFNSLCGVLCDTDFSILQNHINQIKQNDGFWWCELFEEEEFDFLGMQELGFEDLVIDLFKDSFANLAEYELKESLLIGDGSFEEYSIIKDALKYEDFLQKIVNELFLVIEIEVEKYRTSNFEFVTQQNLSELILKQNEKFSFLSYLVQRKNDTSAFNEFMRQSLSLFDIDAYLEIKTVNNSMLEFFLVTELKKTDSLASNNTPIPSKQYGDPNFGVKSKIQTAKTDYKQVYKNNPRRNVYELGKGLQSLIFTIARIFVVINKFRVVRWKNVELVKAKGKSEKNCRPNLILIEEPEAFLHPNWQSKLADFFVFCHHYSQQYRNKAKINFVIETHSVFFIQKIQILVGEKKVDKNNIQVLYFNNMDKSRRYYEMRLREDGIFLDKFGAGFYDEIHTNNLKIMSLERKN